MKIIMTFKLYSLLGLNKNSNPGKSEIKRAYHKLAMECHPDKNKGNVENENKFKEISNAYEVLSDDNKKRVYDQTGDEQYNNGDSGQQFRRGGGRPGNDIFEQFFRGGRGHPFDPFGRFGFEDENEEQNNQRATIRKQITIPLKDAFDGIDKSINISVSKYCFTCMKKCVNCNGAGTIKQVKSMGVFTQIFTGNCDKCAGEGIISSSNSDCSKCNGKGNYKEESSVNLKIPKGVASGHKLRFAGKGDQPKQANQKAGDLILEVKVLEHSSLKREGNDIHYVHQMPFVKSVVGCDIVIPFFDDKIELNTSIFGVVRHGKKYLIEGKGMPIMNTPKRGNMYIEFNIQYPKIKSNDKIQELESILKHTFGL
jgi:molecular chaperone DnaJ